LIALGCDPGDGCGAVVTLDTARRVVTLAAEWQRMKRKGGDVLRWRVQREGGECFEREFPVSAPASLNEAIGLWPTPDAAAVEGIIFHGRDKVGPATLVLAESAGRAVEWLRALGIEPIRPAAQDWRRVVLGLSRGVKADAAEARAVAMVGAGVLPRLPDGITSGHAAEAVCLAWYAGVMARATG
jgi:hypothetical protein